MDYMIDMMIYVLVLFSPGMPHDLPTFVSTWNTLVVCERKAEVLNEYFHYEPGANGFHCLPSNIRTQADYEQK